MMKDNWSKPVTVEEMYGDWDWEAAVAAVDRSLDPRPHSSIIDMFGALGPGPGDVVLDIGGRDARHGLEMAERFGCRVISVDPAELNIADARAAISEHKSGDLVEAVHGFIEQIPANDGAFDFIFSRDMFAHVSNADRALAECARVLAPDGLMLFHQVFATDLLEPIEAAHLYGHTAAVPERFSAGDFEKEVETAGFDIEGVDVGGSEWDESAHEAGIAPNERRQVALPRALHHSL